MTFPDTSMVWIAVTGLVPIVVVVMVLVAVVVVVMPPSKVEGVSFMS